MAFIRLINNRGKFVSPEQGLTIWRVMTGEIKGTKAQREFVKNVYRVYLNPHNAPPSYRRWKAKVEKQPVNQVRLPYAD